MDQEVISALFKFALVAAICCACAKLLVGAVRMTVGLPFDMSEAERAEAKNARDPGDV